MCACACGRQPEWQGMHLKNRRNSEMIPLCFLIVMCVFIVETVIAGTCTCSVRQTSRDYCNRSRRPVCHSYMMQTGLTKHGQQRGAIASSRAHACACDSAAPKSNVAGSRSCMVVPVPAALASWWLWQRAPLHIATPLQTVRLTLCRRSFNPSPTALHPHTSQPRALLFGIA